jgi:tripartite-type tricarboxylate transporter receptor subunit TctC
MKLMNPLTVFLTGLFFMFLMGRAQAEPWAGEPVEILVPFNAGTPPDVSTRIIARQLTLQSGRTFVVMNKPGANGLVALTDMDMKPADGSTVMTLLTPVVVGPALLPNFKKDLAADYVSLGQYDWTYSVLVTSPKLPVKDVHDLIKLMRSKPNALSFASGGYGTPAHLAGELFKLQYDVSAVHVPYNQFTAGLTDLKTGRIDYMFLTSTVAAPLVKAGLVKALAVASGEKRIAALPDVPTLDELGFKNFDVRNWDGFITRLGTPKEFADRFTEELNKVLADPETHKRLSDLGVDPLPSTDPKVFNDLVRNDQSRLKDLVRRANIVIK